MGYASSLSERLILLFAGKRRCFNDFGHLVSWADMGRWRYCPTTCSIILSIPVTVLDPLTPSSSASYLVSPAHLLIPFPSMSQDLSLWPHRNPKRTTLVDASNIFHPPVSAIRALKSHIPCLAAASPSPLGVSTQAYTSGKEDSSKPEPVVRCLGQCVLA